MTPLRVFLLFMPATLVILGAPEATEARHYASSTLPRVETYSVTPKVQELSRLMLNGPIAVCGDQRLNA